MHLRLRLHVVQTIMVVGSDSKKIKKLITLNEVADQIIKPAQFVFWTFFGIKTFYELKFYQILMEFKSLKYNFEILRTNRF